MTESSAVSDSLLSSYQEIQDKLEKEYDYITNGIILRSKVMSYELGEKSIKYFLSLEKKNKARSHVRKIFLRDSNDHETENPKEILSELKLFYEDLYARKSAKTEQECLSYLGKVNTPKLSEEERDSCDGQLSIQEYWNALNSMQNGKVQVMMKSQGILCMLLCRVRESTC